MYSRPFLAALALLGLPMLAAAQGPQLTLPSFANLQQKATESVDLTIGSFAMGLLSGLMDDHGQDGAQMSHLLKGLKAVQIRVYRFQSDFAYSKADIDAVRSQLSAPGWSHLTQVRDRKTNADVDICVALDERKVTGFAIIASEPRGFTILNIVGAVDLAQVAELQKQLNLPDSGVGRLVPNTP
jgi:Domain of unknown function (DUF4252)